jgi:3-keto-5-aminohexanoate cleavage enzyme
MKELRTTPKLIITVAQTGAFHGKEANPNLPITPVEIVQATYDSWNEGASIVHIHARQPDSGKPTNDPDIFRQIDQGIRERGCDIIIQHSTASDYIPRLGEDRRIRAIEMDPEMASLSVYFTRMISFGGTENIRVATLEEIEHGASEMLERGIKPELEIYNYVSMHHLESMIDKGLFRKPYWIDFVFGMHRTCLSFMPYSPRYLIWLVDMLPPDSMFSVAGVGLYEELSVTTLSILLGGHLRVGLEDNIHYQKGQLAESNAQLVARSVRIARELGCEIASPEEARQMLGIPALIL